MSVPVCCNDGLWEALEDKWTCPTCNTVWVKRETHAPIGLVKVWSREVPVDEDH